MTDGGGGEVEWFNNNNKGCQSRRVVHQSIDGETDYIYRDGTGSRDAPRQTIPTAPRTYPVGVIGIDLCACVQGESERGSVGPGDGQGVVRAAGTMEPRINQGQSQRGPRTSFLLAPLSPMVASTFTPTARARAAHRSPSPPPLSPAAPPCCWRWLTAGPLQPLLD